MKVLESNNGLPELKGIFDIKSMKEILKPKIKQWILDNETMLSGFLTPKDQKLLLKVYKGIKIKDDSSISLISPYDLLIEKLEYGTSEIPKMRFLTFVMEEIEKDVEQVLTSIL